MNAADERLSVARFRFEIAAARIWHALGSEPAISERIPARGGLLCHVSVFVDNLFSLPDCGVACRFLKINDPDILLGVTVMLVRRYEELWGYWPIQLNNKHCFPLPSCLCDARPIDIRVYPSITHPAGIADMQVHGIWP